MPGKDKPLPKPPTSAFGRKRRPEEGGKEPSLMADQMALAMAEGRLEEFMKKEMPDSEYARTLAQMMMGMTGMVPPEGMHPSGQKEEANPAPQEDRTAGTEDIVSGQPPEEVMAAVHAGDVKGLMELLAKEHKKRMPDTVKSGTLHEKKEASHFPADAVQEDGHADAPAAEHPQAMIEKEIIDRLIRIASENSVTPDWIMMRALKLYIEEYQKTGRL